MCQSQRMTACATTSTTIGNDPHSPLRKCPSQKRRYNGDQQDMVQYPGRKTTPTTSRKNGETKMNSISPIAPETRPGVGRPTTTNRDRQGGEHGNQPRIQIPARPDVVRKSGGATIGDHGVRHNTPGNEDSRQRMAHIQDEKLADRNERKRSRGQRVGHTAVRKTRRIVTHRSRRSNRHLARRRLDPKISIYP